ncbi:MAG: CRTAC1 family protein [Verrucomicrobiales bacterium]|nr:CRTAC1 family protein [Verrucomicrobiales bacterium]
MNSEPDPAEPRHPGASAPQTTIPPPSKQPWRLIMGLGASGLLLAVAIILPKLLGPTTVTSPNDISAKDSVQNEAVPSARFADITSVAGVRFTRNSGASNDKLLPETMGGGVAFFDMDDDGDPDLLFVNSTHWPDRIPYGQQPTTHALYRNDGKGTFADVTTGSGLEVSFPGMGVACGDYDNDGKVDTFITAVGGNHLFRNLGGGKFQEVTSAAGVGGSPHGWSTSAAWIDYNNDGRLDLFVCNYVAWSKELDLEANYNLPGIGRAYGPPMNFPGSFPYLYRNDGNGHFTDVSAVSGVQVKKPGTGVPAAKSLGVAPVDLDDDGWIDLIVANDTVQNFVFHNEKNGTFKEIGAMAGLAYGPFGGPRGAMGIDSSRLQDADNLAVAIGNFANEMTALYVSSSSPLLFSDEAISQGIGQTSRMLLTFGVFFFDYDLDGRMDLLTVNGHIEPQISKAQPSQTYAQPVQLFWNAGRRDGFILVPPEKCGRDLLRPIAGRGSAFADFDGDGDLDVVLTQVNGPPLLLRNEQRLAHHWLRLKLVGAQASRDAIGASVRIRVGGRTISRQVMPTRGYLSQSELPVTVGLGEASRIEEVQVTWPGGKVQKIGALAVDTVVTIRE